MFATIRQSIICCGLSASLLSACNSGDKQSEKTAADSTVSQSETGPLKPGGHYILKQYVEQAQLLGTTLISSTYPFTEMVVTAKGDSVWLINGTMELVKLEAKVDGGNNLKLDTLYQLVPGMSANVWAYVDKTYGGAWEYLLEEKVAPVPVVEGSAVTSVLLPVLNSVLFSGKWKEAAAKNADVISETSKVVTFDASGKIEGWSEGDSFRLQLNGDQSQCDCNMMSIKNLGVDELFAWELESNALIIYTVKNTLPDGDKPYYKRQKVYRRFEKVGGI